VLNEEPTTQRLKWEWGDLGFDTDTKLWFIELYDYANLVEAYQATKILLKNGSGVQYQWPERGPDPMWHVRERIFSQDVHGIDYDEKGNLSIQFIPNHKFKEEIPENYDHLAYAYSLSTGKGFIEFCDSEDQILKRIDERWIVVENLSHETVGDYPNIRLVAKRKDIERIVVTDSCIVIEGKL